MPLSSGINPHPHGLKERALTTALTLPPPSPNTEYKIKTEDVRNSAKKRLKH